MSALTLLEAAKLNSGEVKRAAVIEMFARESDLMSAFPWMDITGDSYSYNLEGALPGVAFRGYNEGYVTSYGVINPQTESLKIAGGALDVDKALIKTRGIGVRTSQETMQIKALSLNITDRLINGDSAVNFKEFDGLRKRVSGKQLLPANIANTAANGALSLDTLQAAIDSVDGATHIIASKKIRRRLTAACAAGLGGQLTTSLDAFGRRVTAFNDLPILIADYNDKGDFIMDFDEAGPAGGTDCGSIYVVRFGDGYLTGLQNGTMEVTDLGELEAAPVYRTRVEWLVGMAAMHGRCAARVWGITDVPFVV